jgi:hypothetical protein
MSLHYVDDFMAKDGRYFGLALCTCNEAGGDNDQTMGQGRGVQSRLTSDSYHDRRASSLPIRFWSESVSDRLEIVI